MSRAGSCYCGQVKLSIDGDPIRSLICFCVDCQKMTNSDRLLALWVPRNQLNIEEQNLDETRRIGDSGSEVYNYYCSNCHTRVYSLAPETGVAIVPITLLEDVSGLEPTMAIYTKSALPFTQIPDRLRCYEEMPSRK